LIRRVLPRIALIFGRQAIHSAALGGERGAVVLLGSSHAGKSTLAAASIQWAHCTPLSDDISILSMNKSATVSPAATGLCLWPDSRAALGLPDKQCRPMPGYEEVAGKSKIWFEPQPTASPRPRPISAFVSLLRLPGCPTAALEPISPAEGVKLAFRQSIHFNPAARSPANASRHLQDLAGFASHVPFYRLSYPSEYKNLHRAVDCLMELIQ
jgi:hypothetical protein